MMTNQEKIQVLKEAIKDESKKDNPNYDTINIIIGVINKLKE